MLMNQQYNTFRKRQKNMPINMYNVPQSAEVTSIVCDKAMEKQLNLWIREMTSEE